MGLKRNVRWVRPLVAAVVLAVGAVGAPGCDPTGSEETARRGGIEVVARTASALTNAGVTQVNVTVTGPAEGTPSPHTFQLTQNAGAWTGSLDGLPVGTYTLTSQAVDAGGAVLFTGNASNLSVQAGQSTFVALNLYQVGSDPPFQNEAPFIDLMVAAKRTVAPGETIAVRASATDANGDALLYAWNATAGSFVTATGAAVSWTAPSTEGPVTLTVNVDDQHGATSLAQITIDVALAPGGLSVTPTFVQGPRISSMAITDGQPSVGEQIGVVAEVATDPSCTDPAYCTPIYSWSSTCGTTAPNGNPSGTFLTIESTGPCDVRVDITTASGPHNFGVLKINATAPTTEYEDACTPTTWYRDADGDGYGTAADTKTACAAPAGYVASSDDCDDTKPAVHPGATDIAGNGIDEDCVGGDLIEAANVQWVRRLASTSAGYYLLAPTATGVAVAHGGPSGAAVTVLDASGNITWTTPAASIGGIRVATNGDVVYRSTSVIARYSSTGSLLMGVNDASLNSSSLLALDSAGDIVVVRNGMSLVKLSSTGSHVWESPSFGPIGVVPTTLEIAPDGTFNVGWRNFSTAQQGLTRVSASGASVLSTDTSSTIYLYDFAFSPAFDPAAFAGLSATGTTWSISKRNNLTSTAWSFEVPWTYFASQKTVGILSNGSVVGAGVSAADDKQVLLASSNGGPVALRQLSSTAAAYPSDVAAVGTSLYVAGGTAGTFPGQIGTGGAFVAKINP